MLSQGKIVHDVLQNSDFFVKISFRVAIWKNTIRIMHKNPISKDIKQDFLYFFTCLGRERIVKLCLAGE